MLQTLLPSPISSVGMKVSFVENSKLSKISSSKPEVGQNIALRALCTTRNIAFWIYTFPVHSTLVFPKPLQTGKTMLQFDELCFALM